MTEANCSLSLQMFGPFHIWCKDQSNVDLLDGLRAHKMAPMLLALLTLYHERSLTKDEIITTLWGGGTGESNLNKCVAALIQELGEDGRRIATIARSVRIDLRGAEVDLAAFDQAWEQRFQFPAALRAALDRCEGPLLEGWDDPWVVQARNKYAERIREALQLLVAIAIKAENHPIADHYVRRLWRIGDTAEALSTALLKSYMEARAYVSAKQLYEDYREHLLRAHRLPPPEKMTQMADQIPRVDAEFEPPVETEQLDVEVPGGAVAISSRFYIKRREDKAFHMALARRDGTILIYGPRQVGKSSLLMRGVAQARQAGFHTVVSDFQKLDAEVLNTIDSFCRALLRNFQRQLGLITRPDEYWDPLQSANENLEGYLHDVVLAGSTGNIVWCIDEADRIFDQAYCGSVFGLFRSWHSARAQGKSNIWHRFLLVMSYSTEAALFIRDMQQSPFNVGTRIALEDFTLDQVQALNVLHGSPLQTEEERRRLFELVGGHPYLVRLCLYTLTCQEKTLSDLEVEANEDVGLFRDHLQRLYMAVTSREELAGGLCGVLQGKASLSEMAFVRLRAAGIVAGQSVHSARMRCRLYQDYFARQLL